MESSVITFNKPADIWEEALPLGNGRLGAMIYSGVNHEVIQVNEESMWYGGKRDRHNPDAFANLEKVRELIREGHPGEAEKLLGEAFTSCPAGAHQYQTLGNINIWFEHDLEAKEYCRALHLDSATHNLVYDIGDTTFSRQAFISKPANCMVMKLTALSASETTDDGLIVNETTDGGLIANEAANADSQKKLNFTAKIDRWHYSSGIKKTRDLDGVYLYGDLGKDGFDFGMMLKVKAMDGEAKVVGESIIVNDATEVYLYFAADTSYHLGKSDIETTLENRLNLAKNTAYKLLLKTHVQDYTNLYGRVELDIEDAKSKLLFDYGRYLLICSSRPGDLPANLQGIWNKDFEPAWDSKYTININAQMNYWPAEVTNLSECHLPLFELLKKVRENGRHTAKVMYGCRGFLAHHNTDIHGDSAPQDLWYPATYWTQGAAWLCTHLWTHYEYTRDESFLEEVYPMLLEAALFYVDFLTPYGDYMVTNPSVSPENTYITKNGEKGCACLGPTMDNQIIRDLFDICIKASEILDNKDEDEDAYILSLIGRGNENKNNIEIPGVEDINELLISIKELREKLPKTTIGSDGRIMEWLEEYKEDEPGHRHISHLYGLFPSDQISVDKSPELAKAARKTLEERLANGGGHTGWSIAWITNHYAKLWDGEKAYSCIEKMLKDSIYPNMFDKHPPFQIDGNFGICAAIANMLVQSSDERVVLLPALPSKWSNGTVKGLCLVGNATIDICFENGSLKEFTITAKSDFDKAVIYKDKKYQISLQKGESKTVLYEG